MAIMFVHTDNSLRDREPEVSASFMISLPPPVLDTALLQNRLPLTPHLTPS